MNYMVKTLKMFEFGSWDATSRTSKMPTTMPGEDHTAARRGVKHALTT